MDERRALVAEMLEMIGRIEHLLNAVLELSDEDFDKLMKSELRAPVSSARAAAKKPKRGKADTPVEGEAFEGVHARLTAAVSREEGQRIVEEAFVVKAQLFGFAKWLDLPVQRNDAAKRIREKVVTHTVGRRLSGKAVRGSAGGIASGEAGC